MEEENSNIEDSSKEKGDALEKNIEFIFQSAGFETQRNPRIAKYEIDVLAKIGDRKIVIECKNYQNSNLTVRNLVHQWNSKNNLIKANKIIIVIAGVKIKSDDIKLASELNIELWDDNTLNNLFNLSLKPKKLREELLKKIDLRPISISDQYRDNISEFVIYPKISNLYYEEETLYEYFNDWLRIYIRTELQLNGTTKEERTKHIELFEGTKERNGFLNLIKVKRKEKNYWNLVREKLEKQSFLEKSMQKRYLSYMNDLLSEFEGQENYFLEHQGEDLVKRLISDRLYLALVRNQTPIFGFKTDQCIYVQPISDGKFILRIDTIRDKAANLVNWVLTSEFEYVLIDREKNLYAHSWICLSFDETVDKIYRILDEFFGYQEGEKLIDYSL